MNYGSAATRANFAFAPIAMAAMTAIVLVMSMPRIAQATEISVAAASDLTFAMAEIVDRYQAKSGDKVTVSFGSSGNFFSQIQNGAPFDLFFSADADYPKKLADAGLADSGSLYEYAIGKLVVWVPTASKVDIGRGIDALTDPSITRIAIANPDHAPYGRAAVAAMRLAGIYDQLKGKLVLGENISLAAQFAQSGNADAGVIAASIALSPAMKSAGRYGEVAPGQYPPVRQAAVILKSSHDPAAARRMLDFFKEPSVAAILARYGFSAPTVAAGIDAKGR